MKIQTELMRRYQSDEFYSVVYDPAIASMREYAANAYKDIDANIGRLNTFVSRLSQVDDVVVMGHTLMGIDIPYYEHVLIPLFAHCGWTIYVHTKDDESMAAAFVEKYQIGKYQTKPW